MSRWCTCGVLGHRSQRQLIPMCVDGSNRCTERASVASEVGLCCLCSMNRGPVKLHIQSCLTRSSKPFSGRPLKVLDCVRGASSLIMGRVRARSKVLADRFCFDGPLSFRGWMRGDKCDESCRVEFAAFGKCEASLQTGGSAQSFMLGVSFGRFTYHWQVDHLTFRLTCLASYTPC